MNDQALLDLLSKSIETQTPAPSAAQVAEIRQLAKQGHTGDVRLFRPRPFPLTALAVAAAVVLIAAIGAGGLLGKTGAKLSPFDGRATPIATDSAAVVALRANLLSLSTAVDAGDVTQANPLAAEVRGRLADLVPLDRAKVEVEAAKVLARADELEASKDSGSSESSGSGSSGGHHGSGSSGSGSTGSGSTGSGSTGSGSTGSGSGDGGHHGEGSGGDSKSGGGDK